MFYEISSKLYSQAQAAGNAEATQAGTENAEGVVHDADYKVEDDNNK